MSDELRSVLLELAKQAQRRARAPKYQWQVQTVKWRVVEFDYQEDRPKLKVEPEYRTKTEPRRWLVLQDVQKLARFRRAVELIAQRTGWSEMSEFWLRQFVFWTADHDIDPLGKVEAFLADIEGRPVEWRACVWLTGLSLKQQEEFELSADGLTLRLRRPRPEDFEEEHRLDEYILLGGLLGGKSWHLMMPPTAVLELTMQAQEQNEVRREVQGALEALLLFRLGSVAYLRQFFTSASVKCLGSALSPMSLPPTDYSYSFGPEDKEPFDRLWRLVRPAVLRPGGTAPERPHVEVALGFYKDALLRIGGYAEKIARAVACLEALFLKPSEQSELSRRLAQRVGRLLGFLPIFESLEVYDKVKEAYRIRSKFVHGAPLKADRDNARLCETVLNYARISIQCFLQIDKSEFIKDLDRSLLSDRIREETARKLKRLVITW